MTQSDAKHFIPPHGHYGKLLAYRKAEIVHDITVRFCKKFLSNGDRTVDQTHQRWQSEPRRTSQRI